MSLRTKRMSSAKSKEIYSLPSFGIGFSSFASAALSKTWMRLLRSFQDLAMTPAWFFLANEAHVLSEVEGKLSPTEFWDWVFVLCISGYL
jgi:hypothetical protein